MKLTLILIAIVASVIAVPDEEWHDFKQLHGKAYASEAEDAHRKNLYGLTKTQVAAHNENFAKGLVSYELGVTQFADLSHEEFVGKYTGGFDRKNVKLGLGVSFADYKKTLPNQSVPDSLDWRDYGIIYVPWNQGLCNSCYAFSATGALEAQMGLKTKVMNKLSEQNIMDCSRAYGNNGCNKGLMGFAFNWIKDNGGIEGSTTYPYEAKDGECRYKAANSVASDAGYIELESGNEEELKEAIALLGPISVVINMTPFQYYTKNVFYNTTCTNDWDHAILAVGYGHDDASNMDYFIVKNSWGTNWGDAGFAKVARNKDNHCGIASYGVWPLPTPL